MRGVDVRERPLCVLVTNTALLNRAGSELYVRDLAVELHRRGHKPLVYSPRLGGVAQEIRLATIPVVDNLDSIGSAPDLIHGQHHLETMTALARFPGVPAVCVCHGWLPWEETPARHPRILHYVAVSDAVRDRIVYEHGIPEDRVRIIRNFVDTERFRLRAPLPPSPRKALLFDNHATEQNYVKAIREACSQLGMALDVVGLYNGNPTSRPEALLGDYDLVFARGRAALEGLAVGAPVVCCGVEGAGPMVSMGNLERLRRHNFGIRILDQPITVDWACEEVRKYDPADAAAVSQAIREGSSLTGAVDQMLDLYRTTLVAWRTNGPRRISAESVTAEGRAVASYLRWMSLSAANRVASEPHTPLRSDPVTAGREALRQDLVRTQAELGTLSAERDRLAEDLRRLQAELSEREALRQDLVRTQAQLGSVSAERDRLTEASRRLQAELSDMRGTLTWRAHQRITGITLLRKAYLLLAAPFKRRQGRQRSHESQTSGEAGVSDMGDPEPDADSASNRALSSPVSTEGPDLACVVLSLGAPPSLVPAVRSLLSQNEPAEVVVVNSGGGNPAESLRAAGIDIKVINHLSRLFPGAARNAGILATRAPYVAFLASDCIAEPGWVEGRLKRHRSGCQAVSSAVTNHNARNLWSWVTHIGLFSRRMPGVPVDQAVHYGVSYDRRLFDKFGLFREDLRSGEDSEFNDRLKGEAPVSWAPEVRSAHLHPTTLLGLLRDQYARGRRMAASLGRLTGKPQNRLVAGNALSRIPGSIRLAWRASRGAERSRVAVAAVFLLPAALAYALGAFRSGQRVPEPEQAAPRRRILALLAFHNEMTRLADYFRNVAPQVDGVLALDDGSTDGSGDFVRQQQCVLELIRLAPRTPHVWDEPRNRRLLVEAALRHGAEWILVVDADERLETRFRERADAEIARAEREEILAYRVTLRELWNGQDRYRADGIWGQKQPPRLFKARQDHQFDDRPLHGYWAPLNSQRNGDYPKADLIVYHLRMIHAGERAERRRRYQELDPNHECQTLGYDYMTDETGLLLEALPAGREYEPLADSVRT